MTTNQAGTYAAHSLSAFGNFLSALTTAAGNSGSLPLKAAIQATYALGTEFGVSQTLRNTAPAELNTALTTFNLGVAAVVPFAAAGLPVVTGALLAGGITLVGNTLITGLYDNWEPFKDAVDEYDQGVEDAFDALGEWVDDVYDDFINTTLDVADYVDSKIDDLVSALDAVYEGAADALSDIVIDIRDALSGLGDAISGIGNLFDNGDGSEGGIPGFSDILDELGGLFFNAPVTPLVLDLDQDSSIELTAYNAANASFFDLDGDGFAEQTGWVSPDDGILAIDLNSDGIINDITEVFGNATTDGFIALSALDSNSDNTINVADAQFGDLLVWQDLDGDGYSDDGELQSLDDWNITSISLNYSTVNTTNAGHFVSTQSNVNLVGSGNMLIQDIWFQHDQANSYNLIPENFVYDEDVFVLPQLRGSGDVADLWVSMTQNSDLKTLVEAISSADYSSFSFADFRDDIEDMMFEWAGVENVDPSSRDIYINGQILGAVEAFIGTDWDSSKFAPYSDDPLINAATQIENTWSKLVGDMATKLLVQIPDLPLMEAMQEVIDALDAETSPETLTQQELIDLYAPIFSDAYTASTSHPLKIYADHMSYDYVSNTLIGDVQLFIDTLSENEPSTTPEKVIFWQDEIPIINVFADSFGLSDSEYVTVFADTFLDTSMTESVSTLRNGKVIYGTEGSDSIDGTDANDYISGNSAAIDTTETSDLADTLNGGTGDDRIEGKTGNDTYIYNLGDGNDTVSDYDGTADKIVFGAGITSNDLTFIRTEYDDLILEHRNDANDLTISIDGGGSIVIEDMYGDYNDLGWVIETLEFSDSSTMSASQMRAAAEFYVGQNTDETIDGSKYDDSLDGGDGDDTINGGHGDDSLRGGLGDDFFKDDAGEDSYDGGDGFDHVSYSGRQDNYTINLSTGVVSTDEQTATIVSIEAVTGSFYADTIIGNSDNNYIDGYQGSDSIQGGDGDDTITGEFGIDTIDGGDGFDIAVHNYTGGSWIFDLVNDTASLTGGSAELIYNIEGIVGSTGDDTLLGESDANYLDGDDGDDSISGGDGNDTLAGGVGLDTFDGGAGVDVVDFSYSGVSWTINLNAGTAVASSTTETLVSIEGAIGGLDDDTLIGDSTDNVFDGNDGDDLLQGAGGNDSYYFSHGADTIDDTAGSGDSLDLSGYEVADFTFTKQSDDLEISLTGAQASVLITDQQAVGDAKIETFTFDDYTLTASELDGYIENATLPGGGGGGSEDTVTGSSGTEQFVIDQNQVNDLYIESFNYGEGDRLEISAFDGTVTTLAGLNIVDDGSGNAQFNLGSITVTLEGVTHTAIDATYFLSNTLDYGTGTGFGGSDDPNLPDSIYGGAGDDTVWANSGDDLAVGETGNDLFYGWLGDDTFYGGYGEDTLNGDDGADLLSGGQGNDLVQGGNGDDSVYGAEGDDSVNGNDGADRVFGDEGNDYVLGGNGNDTIYGYDGNDLLYGEADDDLLTGEDGDDYLSGGGGADGIYGHAGVDTLDGGAGADFMDAGADNDILKGGDGTDGLTGGSGADVFVYTNTSESVLWSGDWIYDFVSGTDMLDLSAITTGVSIIGSNAFSAASSPELRYYSVGSNTVNHLDVDGNGTADFEIVMVG
ncbi:MAG: M10 family metallopeptidase C-terminal domain-containing protein, partial [Rickettsiales bacterium]|nr:M10 family metallopeptidase C-terminal domain-containing protein [Rickettsiales bacterium]